MVSSEQIGRQYVRVQILKIMFQENAEINNNVQYFSHNVVLL